MSFRIALAQTRRPEGESVVEMVKSLSRQARERGADLIVFPEAIMTAYHGDPQAFAAQAEDEEGPFCRAVNAIAAEVGLWIAYTFNERNPEGGRPFNALVVVDGRGRRQASYRKVHLFESAALSESGWMAAGDRLPEPVQTPFCKLGLGICYDLRFPELALRQALAGCEVLLYSAAWVDGPNKVLQWQTLLRARAIENAVFVAGVSSVDEGRAGSSCVFAPDGTLLAQAGTDPELLVADIDLGAIERTRADIFSLADRRPSLYAAIDEPAPR